MADLLPLLHVADKVQRGVVHLAELVYLQHPLNFPGEIVHDVAVAPVKSGLSNCHQVEVKIPVPIVGRPVQQGGVQAKGNVLGRQGLVNHIPAYLRSRSHRRENQHPGVNLIRGQVEPGTGVHDQLLLRGLCRRLAFRLFLAVLAPGPALRRLPPGAAHAL